MRKILSLVLATALIILISLFNALVELYTAVRSILTAIEWTINGFTVEYVVEDQDGNIIHHFPQINFKE